MKNIIKIGIVLLGGIAGYAYYYFIGCRNTGTWMITANPWISTLYGLFFGFLLAQGFHSPQKESK